jgi:hypothetical protein
MTCFEILSRHLHTAEYVSHVASTYVNISNLEICVLLGYCVTSNGNPLPTFRDNVSVPSSRVKKLKKFFLES